MPEQTTINIASHLPVTARTRPGDMAVVYPEGRDHGGRVSYTHYTYAQLDEQSDLLARGLMKIGIARGVRTVLMVNPSLDFFALVFALFKIGAVMVCVDPGIGINNLGKCLAEAEPEAFIGVSKAHIARKILGWGKKTIKTKVLISCTQIPTQTIGIRGLQKLGAQSSQPVLADTKPDETAAILFTSGSTGAPKGVVYSHANFDAQVRALKQVFRIEPGEVDLATFPLFALYAPALGMTAVIPDMNFTRPGNVFPPRIFEAVSNFGVTNMFGSPALLDRISRWAEKSGVKMPSLKRVISAGAPVPAPVLDRLSKALNPNVQIFTPYGATEALPVCSIGSHEILGETSALTAKGNGVCVGRPAGDMRVEIIKISDDPIAEFSKELLAPKGSVGEIIVKGPVATASYFNRGEADALAKISDSDGRFFHRMGDLGCFDEKGRLWFHGRKSQRVKVAGDVHFTIPCEAVFNVHPKVFRTALVGAFVKGTMTPTLCVELEKEFSNKDFPKIRKELLEMGALYKHTQMIQNILLHPGFPVDIRHNAKIGREKLAAWASKKLK